MADWLPEDHLAYFVSDLVDDMDLSAIESVYEQEDRGQPPYDTRMMTKSRKDRMKRKLQTKAGKKVYATRKVIVEPVFGEAYPDLEREDIREALRFTAEAVRERELPLVNTR